MIRKKSIMAAALAAVLACQTFPAFGAVRLRMEKPWRRTQRQPREALTMRGRNGGRS